MKKRMKRTNFMSNDRPKPNKHKKAKKARLDWKKALIMEDFDDLPSYEPSRRSFNY